MKMLKRLGRGQGLAATLGGSTPGRIKWVGIYWLDLNRDETEGLLATFGVAPPANASAAFRVRVFEVDGSYDESHWLGEDDLKNQQDIFAFSESELSEVLLKLGVDQTQLRSQGETAYPI